MYPYIPVVNLHH